MNDIYKHKVCKYLNMDLDTELRNNFWELLYEKLIEKAEKLQTKHETEQLRIHSVVVPKVTLCGCGAELIKDAIGIEYCGNTLCKGK